MSQSSFWLASIWQADCLKLFGMTHMQHRYHRYFKNTSYYSNNSGLEKYLMLLDLKILTIIFLEELIFIQFKEKQSRQMKEIGEILQPFFFPTPKSNDVSLLADQEQSYFPYGHHCSLLILFICTWLNSTSCKSVFVWHFFFKKTYLCSGPNVSWRAVCAGIWWSGTNTTFNWRARRSRSCHGFRINRRLIQNSFPLNFIPNFTCNLSQFIQKLHLKEKKNIKEAFLNEVEEDDQNQSPPVRLKNVELKSSEFITFW